MNIELEKEFPVSPEDRIIEECAELIQAVQKARRFGWTSSNPNTRGVSNFLQVIIEINDVRESLTRLENHMTAIEMEYRYI